MSNLHSNTPSKNGKPKKQVKVTDDENGEIYYVDEDDPLVEQQRMKDIKEKEDSNEEGEVVHDNRDIFDRKTKLTVDDLYDNDGEWDNSKIERLNKQAKNGRDLSCMVRSLHSGGNWFMFFPCFLRILDPRVATTLCYLMNFATRTHKQSLRNDGWFFCKVSKMAREIYLEKRTQSNHLKCLCDNGFIWTKRMDVPSKRYIKINYIAVIKAVVDSDILWQKEHPEYFGMGEESDD